MVPGIYEKKTPFKANLYFNRIKTTACLLRRNVISQLAEASSEWRIKDEPRSRPNGILHIIMISEL